MIYVECYPDKALVAALGVSKRDVIHAYGKGNVCKKLKDHCCSIGLIDEDPESVQPSYLNNLQVYSEEHRIRYLYDKNNNNRVIILCPKLEEWILMAARESNISLSDYNLPEDPGKLHDVLAHSIDKFTNLLKAIYPRCNGMKHLKELLTESNFLTL